MLVPWTCSTPQTVHTQYPLPFPLMNNPLLSAMHTKPSSVLSVRTNDYLRTHKHAQAEVSLIPQKPLGSLEKSLFWVQPLSLIRLSINFNTFNGNTKTITHMHVPKLHDVGLNFNWSREPRKFKGSNTFWTLSFQRTLGMGTWYDICPCGHLHMCEPRSACLCYRPFTSWTVSPVPPPAFSRNSCS